MSDRLHEIIGEVAIIHKKLIQDKKIDDISFVFDFLDDYDADIKEHYLNLLLQYYFQKNDLPNLKEVLLVGANFDMRFEDVKEAFLNINSSSQNVIEFMEEAVVFIKDNDIEANLVAMFDYYESNPEIQVYLEESVELIKRNRYVCAYCYKNSSLNFAHFFLNEDLLESLKRDLPYLLK